MFGYYLELGLRSLKRSPGLTALMVLAIGFGVAASMTTWSVFRAVSGDPIPWKSSKLFVPQIDIMGPQGRKTTGAGIAQAMDYTDAVALMRDHRAKLQSAMYPISPSIVPAEAGRHTINVSGYAVYSEFFPMLDVPFLYGSGWNASDGEKRAPAVVISKKLNQKLFGGADSVGQSVNIQRKYYRVVGVLKDWNPQPRFYDAVNSGGFRMDSVDVFLPFQTAIQENLPTSGITSCYVAPAQSGFAGLQQSSCVWIAYMIELDDAAAVTAYRHYLDDYARDQQTSGRFHWPPHNRVRDMLTWLDSRRIIPSDTKVSLLVAMGLLLVCMVNTVGLLLAKFLRRSGEIGVRRALGAPSASIYAQFLTEAGIVGMAGGVLGLLLTGVGVASVGWIMPKEIAALAHLDFSLLGLTLLVAVVATLLAGLYPTFRASRVQPAWQLKSH